MTKTPPETIHPKTRKAWRTWLSNNHAKSKGVWLIFHKKSANKDRLPYADAVEEALCFGWIDAMIRPIDAHTYMQWYCQRKPKSVWSKLNKTRVEKLLAAGQMTSAGQAKIDLAKSNGQWSHLDAVESLTLPLDFAKALRAAPGARNHFDSLSPSARKILLYRIHDAKRPETRAARIAAATECCATKQHPTAFRPLRP
ncbi:MAG: hypothetical protein JWN40_5450 [Phycisphaerales bacterium]|nr:hypothetical protein [Phycisphaerales bacterium]